MTGSVCFRAVQLNSFIGGRAKHVHEVQGEESSLFVSYYQDYIQAAKAGTFLKTKTKTKNKTKTKTKTKTNAKAKANAKAEQRKNKNWVILTAVLGVPTEGLVYLEGGTETAFRKAPKVGVEYDVPRLYRFYFKYTFPSIPSRSFTFLFRVAHHYVLHPQGTAHAAYRGSTWSLRPWTTTKSSFSTPVRRTRETKHNTRTRAQSLSHAR
jgi:hypothetical protein